MQRSYAVSISDSAGVHGADTDRSPVLREGCCYWPVEVRLKLVNREVRTENWRCRQWSIKERREKMKEGEEAGSRMKKRKNER